MDNVPEVFDQDYYEFYRPMAWERLVKEALRLGWTLVKAR